MMFLMGVTVTIGYVASKGTILLPVGMAMII